MPKRKNLNKLPPFVALTWEMLNSKAYRELPPSAAKLLPYFLGKAKVGFNNPDRYTTVFTFSFPEAKRYGFAAATFSRAYKKLIELGFIDRVERGGLRGKGESYNKFTLSRKWGKDESSTHTLTARSFCRGL